MMIQSVDIITQILYRLPSKSVGRFRCVSKGWLCLLTDPKFIETHQKTLNRNHLLFRDSNQLYSHPFDHHDPFILKPTKLPIELGDHITFHGSCDGLVLVSYRTCCMDPLDTLVLLNPTTRESVQLPQSAGRYHHHESLHINYSTHGVGYDSVTDDYKVITLTYYRPDSIDRVSVYSLRSNTWRQLIIDSPYECSRYSPPAVYVNGFLHWFGKKKGDDDSQVIVAFSLVDECFSEVPLPNWTKIPFDIFDDEFGMVSSMIFDDDNGKIRVDNEKKEQMLIYDFEKRTLSKNVYVWSRRFGLFGSYVESLVSPKTKDTADHSSTERQNVGSKLASEAATLPKNLHPLCIKSLRFAKILNHKKASLRKKEREEEEAKPKNKRRKRQRI